MPFQWHFCPISSVFSAKFYHFARFSAFFAFIGIYFLKYFTPLSTYTPFGRVSNLSAEQM